MAKRKSVVLSDVKKIKTTTKLQHCKKELKNREAEHPLILVTESEQNKPKISLEHILWYRSLNGRRMWIIMLKFLQASLRYVISS
jgi:hypothetical protein